MFWKSPFGNTLLIVIGITFFSNSSMDMSNDILASFGIVMNGGAPSDNCNALAPIIRAFSNLVSVVSKLINQDRIILKAIGNSIPSAVAVANIITEKMLKGTTQVEKINLDTVAKAGIGDMTSTVEIIITKN